MTLSILEVVWYSVFIVVVMGYVVLDGFDLGVGMLHLATKGTTIGASSSTRLAQCGMATRCGWWC
jgi:cytochrome bd-type quinol oxidase subunit 2